jgi:hypothetical protein
MHKNKAFTQDVFSYAKHMAGTSEEVSTEVCLSCGVELRQIKPRHPPLSVGLVWFDPKACKVPSCTIWETLRPYMVITAL